MNFELVFNGRELRTNNANLSLSLSVSPWIASGVKDRKWKGFHLCGIARDQTLEGRR
jgi:hypothetical protein